MNTHQPDLGDCPHCGSEISTGQILIEYETESGRGVWAECPGCSTVVDPL